MPRQDGQETGLPITGDRVDPVSGQRITTAVQRRLTEDTVFQITSVGGVITQITRRSPDGRFQVIGSQDMPLLRLRTGSTTRADGRSGEVLLVPRKIR